MSKVRWAYGVTTCLGRRHTLLPRTMASLLAAGFDDPRVFADGVTAKDVSGYQTDFVVNVTPRIDGAVRTAGNWVLSLAELYLRDPVAHYYAVFQDDLVACKGLRTYLESSLKGFHGMDAVNLGKRRYYNLHTFPVEGDPPVDLGWADGPELSGGQHPQNFQQGRGAVALVFPREGVLTLLSARHLWDRFGDVSTGWRNIDGGVVTAMNLAGWRELIHYPSLVKHTGAESTTRDDRRYARMESYRFPGEEFDATQWLPQPQVQVQDSAH